MRLNQRLAITVAVTLALIVGGAGAMLLVDRDGASLNRTAQAQEFNSERGIFVDGEGQVTVAPDTAFVTVGVQLEGEEVEDLREEANSRMDAVIQQLQEDGIDERDIRTITYDISVKRDWEARDHPIVGYTLTHLIEVKVVDIDETGNVIDSALDSGANIVGNIRFEVEDRAGAIRQAREQAMQDAFDKAEHLAELGGVALGAPIRISESSPSLPPVYYDEMAPREMADEAVAATPIQPGESVITVHVSITYAIE